MLANEDDCSASPSSSSPNGEIPLFDTFANKNITSQLGPPGPFVNEFGHICTRAAATSPTRTGMRPATA